MAGPPVCPERRGRRGQPSARHHRPELAHRALGQLPQRRDISSSPAVLPKPYNITNRQDLVLCGLYVSNIHTIKQNLVKQKGTGGAESILNSKVMREQLNRGNRCGGRRKCPSVHTHSVPGTTRVLSRKGEDLGPSQPESASWHTVTWLSCVTSLCLHLRSQQNPPTGHQEGKTDVWSAGDATGDLLLFTVSHLVSPPLIPL